LLKSSPETAACVYMQFRSSVQRPYNLLLQWKMFVDNSSHLTYWKTLGIRTAYRKKQPICSSSHFHEQTGSLLWLDKRQMAQFETRRDKPFCHWVRDLSRKNWSTIVKNVSCNQSKDSEVH